MKITANKDLHVTTTWGASIHIAKGEVREVGDDLGLQALQQGAVEVKEETKKPAAKKKVTKKKRARTKDGHYKADDPSTPDVNEAYVEE
tara:strand:+ start:396 stop:662 length:267 start_codon:yes stop_codon:yes gene_type:complete